MTPLSAQVVLESIPGIEPSDEIWRTRAHARLDTLTKPLGSLGRLEDLAAQLVAIRQGHLAVPLSKAVYVFAADHGITAEGVSAYAGSPFFEVAQYAGRWFLRDGYHRAYKLLQAGIFQLPAVIVRARTLEELGAAQPRFFSEAILLSEHPPFVSDFLDEDLTIEYDRRPIIKTLCITMEESIASPFPIAISGEHL